MRRTTRKRSYPRPATVRIASGTRSIPDSTTSFITARDWLGGDGGDPASVSEKRAESLIAANRGLLKDFGVEATVGRRAGEPGLLVHTSTRIGAIPLLSPVSGRPDFGLMVEPRFPWSSVGEMLAGMGFRIVPDLLPLPDLPQSERRVPPWVLSSIVLARLQRLLDSMQRRFVISETDLNHPKGAVQWHKYVTERFAHGRALDVPCSYPDLRDDENLRSAIHWVVRRHRDALLSQAAAGIVVRQLIALCDQLIARLIGSIPRAPGPGLRDAWRRRPIMPRIFRDGLQAIEWTVDERGLAGMSDLSGIAWRMDMEFFFEAWVEAIADRVAKRVGASLEVGRRGQTKVPLDWTPPSLSSQRSLVPDIVIRRDDAVVVIDAKYKRHADEIERLGWHDVDAVVKEQHRNDVLQALAYSTLFDAPRVVACLAYPAGVDRWEELRRRNRVASRARVRSGKRQVELALLAVPLSGFVDGPAADLEHFVRNIV